MLAPNVDRFDDADADVLVVWERPAREGPLEP
jgi:hypothetical protein